MEVTTAIGIGIFLYLFVRLGLGSIFTVGPSERAVKTTFGRAQRLGEHTTLELPIAEYLEEEEKMRYAYPQVRVIGPGLHFKFPWQEVHRASIAIETVNMAFDPETPQANEGGKVLEAVTKDHLNTGLTGQIRVKVSEANLYAYLFAVKNPLVHTLGYFVSVLRQMIASFESQSGKPKIPSADPESPVTEQVQVSINDLRKNLRDINDRMYQESLVSAARYGMMLDASLITGIEPPQEVEAALAAINTAHNHVSSDLSLAQASADQRIVESKRAVEIETLKAQAEVQPLLSLAEQLRQLKAHNALSVYIENLRLGLIDKASRILWEQR